MSTDYNHSLGAESMDFRWLGEDRRAVGSSRLYSSMGRSASVVESPLVNLTQNLHKLNE